MFEILQNKSKTKFISILTTFHTNYRTSKTQNKTKFNSIKTNWNIIQHIKPAQLVSRLLHGEKWLILLPNAPRLQTPWIKFKTQVLRYSWIDQTTNTTKDFCKRKFPIQYFCFLRSKNHFAKLLNRHLPQSNSQL